MSTSGTREGAEGTSWGAHDIGDYAILKLKKWRSLLPNELMLLKSAVPKYCENCMTPTDDDEIASPRRRPFPKTATSFVLGLISVPYSGDDEFKILVEKMLSSPILKAIGTENYVLKYAVEVENTKYETIMLAVLRLISCGAGPQHQATVAYLTTQAVTWCEANAPDVITATSDHNQTLGSLGAAPDVTILPCAGQAASQYPRFIIEVEVNHRSILALRERVNRYFDEDQGNNLRGVLGVSVKPNTFRAAAVMWMRDAGGMVAVNQTLDFGRLMQTATQIAKWAEADAALAPAANALVRYDPQMADWPSANQVANWTAPPGQPIVTIPPAHISHNLLPGVIIGGALQNLQLNLGRALECAARI